MFDETRLQALKVDREDEVFQVLSYCVQCCNRFFRLIRAEGVWLAGNACRAAKEAGMEMNASCLQLARKLWWSLGLLRVLGAPSL